MLRKRPRSFTFIRGERRAKVLWYAWKEAERGGINGDNIEFTISYTGVERRLGMLESKQRSPSRKRSIERDGRGGKKFPFYTRRRGTIKTVCSHISVLFNALHGMRDTDRTCKKGPRALIWVSGSSSEPRHSRAINANEAWIEMAFRGEH